MGITIHFQGNLKNTKLLPALVDELTDISKTLNWQYRIWDEDWSKPSTATLVKNENRMEIKGHLSLKGITITLHPDCESLPLLFNSRGALVTPMSIIMAKDGTIEKENSFTAVKTQFAPVDIHVSIIKLLKYLKKRYIPDLVVMDEGEYWDSEDREKLVKKRNFLNEKMTMLEGLISRIEIENVEKCTAEQLADILEKRLKQML